MKRLIFSLCALLLLNTISVDAQLSFSIFEYAPPQYRCRVNLMEDIDLNGTLMAINDEYLILAGFYYRDETHHNFSKIDTIALNRIYSVTINDINRAAKGAWRGFKAGAVYGAAQSLLFLFIAGFDTQQSLQFIGLSILAYGVVGILPGVFASLIFPTKTVGKGDPIISKDVIKLKKYAYLNNIRM